jgi:hypothetical protein
MWVGGIVMYALVRHCRTGAGPALVGATTWMLASFTMGWLQAEMHTPVVVIVPLVSWAVSAALVVGSWQRILGTARAPSP